MLGVCAEESFCYGKASSLPVHLSLLKLSIEETTLNKDHNTIVTLTGTHSDHTTKAVTKGIAWIVTPQDAVAIKGDTLTARKDTDVTIQARVGNTLSNKVKLHIYWEVNGHRLPPEPDPKVNDSTLLGVDVNGNGVRDDVERWIYETYDQPIERGIFMQSARAYQKVIVDPKKAHETVKYTDDVLSCEFYWIYERSPRPFNKYEHFQHRKEFKKVQFNTVKRWMAYERFNAEFNGEVFSAPPTSKQKCEFDEYGNLKAEK